MSLGDKQSLNLSSRRGGERVLRPRRPAELLEEAPCNVRGGLMDHVGVPVCVVQLTESVTFSRVVTAIAVSSPLTAATGVDQLIVIGCVMRPARPRRGVSRFQGSSERGCHAPSRSTRKSMTPRVLLALYCEVQACQCHALIQVTGYGARFVHNRPLAGAVRKGKRAEYDGARSTS